MRLSIVHRRIVLLGKRGTVNGSGADPTGCRSQPDGVLRRGRPGRRAGAVKYKKPGSMLPVLISPDNFADRSEDNRRCYDQLQEAGLRQ